MANAWSCIVSMDYLTGLVHSLKILNDTVSSCDVKLSKSSQTWKDIGHTRLTVTNSA